MRCPSLRELPSPPPGKTGWPWTEESPRLPELMPDGSEYPSISIVTPNYNYGHFLEETIRSVLLQGYPKLEYIILDGGSTDNSIEVIKKYEKWLAYYASEKDNGQTNAINKGLNKCTGEIFNWINSDDFLAQGSLKTVAQDIKGFDALAGAVMNFTDSSEFLIKNQNLSPLSLVAPSKEVVFHQPGLWLRTDYIHKIGGLQENLEYCFDWDLAIRYMFLFGKINYTSVTLAHFRMHSLSKTTTRQLQFEYERQKIISSLLENPHYINLHPQISFRIRQKKWHEFINKVLEIKKLNQENKIKIILSILINSCGEPNIRWSRFTMGAIRKLTLS